jgi:hypothetical protein
VLPLYFWFIFILFFPQNKELQVLVAVEEWEWLQSTEMESSE